MSVFDWVTVVFTAALTVDLARYLGRGELRRDFWVLRTLRRKGRWVWVLPVLSVLIAATLLIGFSLYVLGGPLARWSWLLLLQPSGGPVEGPQNLMTAGLRIPWFVWVFGVLLALNVPRLAIREERAFREGTRGWGEAVWQSVKFGFVHCLVGVPLAFGAALILPGLFFTWVYWQGGVRLSAAWHVVYNYMVLGLAGLALGGVFG